MTTDRITTYHEFWPYYLKEHSKKSTRSWHFAGTTLAFFSIVAYAFTLNGLFIFLALLGGYGFAWFSHFTIEKNRPATFKHPFWSLYSDWRMWVLAITGQLQKDLQKYKIQ